MLQLSHLISACYRGKLVSLDLSFFSMFINFFNFSPDIIYAYPFVFLNPLELKATPAKE